ncbi:MAG TPA: EAL domain-containing protein [Acidimicrobiales bacterium]|nr:EAL domain-containing protein [Acidimicrobiales bacterium]
MALPARAKALIAATVLGAVAAVALVATEVDGGSGTATGIGQGWLTLFLTLVLLGSLVKPLLVYHESESLGIHLDEACLVMMLLVLPPGSVLLGFGAAIVGVELYRRPPLSKVLFNAGQRTISLVAAVEVFRLVASPGLRITVADLLAAALAAGAFFATNTLLVGWVVAAVGQARLRTAVFEALGVRALLLVGNVAMGLVAAMAMAAYPWAAVLAALPLVILREVLAGHFRARHDRYRLRGLFEATSAAHQALDPEKVRETLERSASVLLRGRAVLRWSPPVDREFGTEVAGPDPLWLVVSGRSRNEPLDDVDQSLLDALGAVGSSALSNASVFEERSRDRQRLLAITSSLGEGVCAIDGDATITFANPVATELLGLSADAFELGQPAPEWLAEPATTCMRTALTVRSDDATFRRPDGSTVPVAYTASPIIEHGEAVGAVIAFSDISERKRFEDRLTHQAFHDQLTGLPNRRLFLDRLSHALRRSQRGEGSHAVLFLDVDRFKVTNDGLGHKAGDQLLVAIAERISAMLRPADTLARFGGDEFAILVEDVRDEAEATALAERVQSALRRPIQLSGAHDVVASVSIGIALTAGRDSADDIVHDADVAMYQAKNGGAGRFVVFDVQAMGARSAERVRLEAELRRALHEGGIEVFYQPLADTLTGAWVGAEALVRWRHPEEGLLSPDRFIGLAEDTGLILPLGRLVLEAACRQGRVWAAERSPAPFTVSVNLSARQFRDPGLAEDVASILAITGVPASCLCLEITESVAVDDVELTVATLGRLKALGVRLAIDDFGTGYSSLSYLKRFPVDVVKVDRTFVQALPGSRVDGAIVSAVVDLARAIGMVTVAEGVETEEQRAHLESIGCPLLQGYLLARPMPAGELTDRLADRAAPRP